METAIRFTWGKLVPGREAQALDLFADVTTYFGKKMADAKVTYFEPFLLKTGDFNQEQGFMIVKGPAEEIARIEQDEEYDSNLGKAHYLLEHFKVDYLVVGEGIGEELERGAKVRTLLKI
ncbi:MAG: hypothetical protein WEB06_19125 [Actinomycetota bacterium]